MDIFTQASGSAVLLAILIGLIEIIKILIKKVGKRESILLPDEREWIKDLWEAHQKTDAQGVPLWYVPRGCADSQEKLLDKLSQISSSQEKISYVLESIMKYLMDIRSKS